MHHSHFTWPNLKTSLLSCLSKVNTVDSHSAWFYLTGPSRSHQSLGQFTWALPGLNSPGQAQVITTSQHRGLNLVQIKRHQLKHYPHPWGQPRGFPLYTQTLGILMGKLLVII